MSQRTKDEMLPRMRERYVRRGRAGRGRLLDEACELLDCSRKHAIKLLNARAGWGGDAARRKGRPPVYSAEAIDVLWELWKEAEQPCGKRLAAMREQWLPFHERRRGKLKASLRREVLSMSAAQIDRVLAPRKARLGGRGRSSTRPGGMLKTQIPIRTDSWDVSRPGYLEADTVAHCGESMAGDFIWSVTFTDIHSGWTLSRAIWNRGEGGVLEATREAEATLPFELLGFDCDNGGEFINHHLLRHFRERERPVEFTRSRPYHKDDNGHVEQKNWTRVRQLFGYGRLEDPGLVGRMNAVYRDAWDLLHNYFMPSAKLLAKERHGAKVHRRHDAPRTPCQRLLESPHVSAQTKRLLRERLRGLDPFALRRKVEEGLAGVLSRALHSSRPTGSLRCARGRAKSQSVPVS